MVKGISPVQRTLRELRKQGLVADIVERRLPAGPGMPYGKTLDFLHIIDLMALDPNRGVVGIQVCGSDVPSHMKKIKEQHVNNTIAWLETPGTSLEVWGWRKVKLRRGGKAMRWSPRVRMFSLDDLEVA